VSVLGEGEFDEGEFDEGEVPGAAAGWSNTSTGSSAVILIPGNESKPSFMFGISIK